MLPARQLAGAAALLLVTMLVPRVARAQALTPPPPGPYVIDVRGTTLGVPQTSDFYPDIPVETVIPARGFGLQVGAHLYPLPLGSWRLGVGVDVFLARATATTPTTSSSSSATSDITTAAVTVPDVKVTQRVVLPQISINFGTGRGWSYLSTGAGSARVKATADSDVVTTSRLAVSVGGGARWFLTGHVGVGFDLRALWLGSRATFAASAGFSLK